MTIHQHRTWTEDRADRAAKLWLNGVGATTIATILGNTSRNAIIGKMHRMGLGGAGRAGAQDEPKPAPRKPRAKKVYPSRSKAPEVPVPRVSKRTLVFMPPAFAEGHRVTVMDLVPGVCRWPLGDPGSEAFSFCGRRTEPCASYCTHHARIAYQPVVKRRRRAVVHGRKEHG